MIVRRLVVGPFEENSYVVGDEATKEGALIDPGGDVDELLALAEQEGLKIGKILITHAHIDHVTGAAEARRKTKAATHLHPADRDMLASVPGQAAMFGLPPVEVPEIDVWLEEGQVVKVGGLSFRVLFVPGHAPGHVVYAETQRAFVGDTIFAGSIGRTDFPGCSFDQLVSGIRGKIFKLGDAVLLHPGHGPDTTVSRERKTNPFVGEDA